MAIDRTKQTSLPGRPDAVATERGWVDPKTGELLVAIRGLEAAKKKAEPPKVETKARRDEIILDDLNDAPEPKEPPKKGNKKK